ncbi:BTB/POZ domain-containing protein 17 [Aphelenchoides avenae]|nr:BTB/POZ domain-containing protein 17 [Aphelenchus avenae]
MQNWDVILSVGDKKFYAHKQILSLMSTTFHAMFNGDFREKNQQEVPVNVEGTNASHFEAFLQCLYPHGRKPMRRFMVPLATLADYYGAKHALEICVDMARLPYVSKLDMFRVAMKTHSTALEDEAISAMSKGDIRELLASDVKKHLDGVRWEKLMTKALSLRHTARY